MKLNTIIVEDSEQITETIELLLEQSTTPTNILGKAQTIKEASQLIAHSDIDLAILDIQLREGNIFSLLEDLKKKDNISFDIIFITAHSSFENAVKAIEFACLDFITKPISQDSLNKALQKVAKRHESNTHEKDRIELLLELIQNNLDKPKSISIALPRGIIEIIELHEVTYFEADGSTSLIQFSSTKKLHSTKPLSHYSKLLDTHPDFMQISRDMLVNLHQIKRYNHRDKTITLKNDLAIIASHRYSKYLKQKLSELSIPTKSGILDFLK